MEPERKYYKDGSIYREEWRVNGEWHRLDGPAIICYYEDGSIHWEQWFVNGKLHRLDGPSDIQYNEDGSIQYEHWFVNGIEIDDPLWLKENNIISPLSDEDLMAIKLRWG
jgi:antitoxin component YwqK of YwqJK toxin-antitoxin module